MKKKNKYLVSDKLLHKCVLVAMFWTIPMTALAWDQRCDGGECNIYGYASIDTEDDLTLYMLEARESGKITVTAIYPREYHERWYTTNPTTYIKMNGTEYVPVASFFTDDSTGILTVDGGKGFILAPQNESQLVNRGDANEIVELFKTGAQATIDAGSMMVGPQKVSISLLGFTSAFSGLSPSEKVEADDQLDPYRVLKSSLAGNHLSVSVADLQEIQNPDGEGFFVYSASTQFSGTERLLVWFAKGGEVVALNGATNGITPDLPYPRDTALSFWEGTGLSRSNATSKGLSIVFDK